MRYEPQDVLIQLWRGEKITAMMVTHHVDEALFLSDHILCMTAGPGEFPAASPVISRGRCLPAFARPELRSR